MLILLCSSLVMDETSFKIGFFFFFFSFSRLQAMMTDFFSTLTTIRKFVKIAEYRTSMNQTNNTTSLGVRNKSYPILKALNYCYPVG